MGMKDLKPMHAITEAEFREFVRGVQDMALCAYPNPGRVGCPDLKVLQEVAGQSRPAAHPVFKSHIVECSPCIAQMLAERTRIQAQRQLRRRMVLALAAGICVVALLSGLWLSHRAAAVARDQLASAQEIPEISIDLRPYSPTRSDAAPDTKPPIVIPPQRVKLKLYLALGSPAGAYEIQILSNDLRPMRSVQASAMLVDGVTFIPVALDLGNMAPGTYVLALRPAREGEEWQSFPLVLRRSR
jgi:hypothetical protein